MKSTKFVSTVAAVAMATGVAMRPVHPLAQGMILEQVLVKVNGEIFTKTDLESLQIQALKQKNRQVNNPADLQNDATLKAALLEVTPTILTDAVDDLLEYQRAKELGLQPTAEQLKDAEERLKKQNNITTDAQFRAALTQEGLTYEEFSRGLERNYAKARLEQTEVMPRVQLTDEESRQYYLAHTKDFEKPASLTIRDIFIAVPTQTMNGEQVVNAATAESIEKKITDVRARALGGEDFAKLVTEFSESPSKANQGLIGPLNENELAPQLKDMLGKMKVGEITPPIRTANGYQLIKLESRTAAAPEPFEAVKDQIAERIGGERVDAERKKYIEKLRAQAIIEWKNDDLKKLYEQKLAEAKTDKP